jgi:hypothetical protein
VEIPDSVTTIGERAFYNCDSLTSVEIPDSVTTIGEWAFYHCDSLTSVEIGNGVTSIGEKTFSGCSSLTSMVIGDSVTSIGEQAFDACDSLTSITVKEGNQYLKSIDGNLYNKDETILIQYAIGKMAQSFTIPDSVTSIGYYAFSGCSNLTSVEIGDSVTTIGESAFYNCSNLTSVVIPDSVTSINKNAFSYCSSLTSVEMGDSVTTIGNSAFHSCSSLTSVVIPNSVTSIGSYALAYCISLTSVVIDDSVTSMGNFAFKSCSSLTSVRFKNETPPSVEKIINSQINSTTPTYYVPVNSVEIYRTAWSGVVAEEQIQPAPGERLITVDGLKTYHNTLKEKHLDSMATQDWVTQYIRDNFATLMAEYLNSAEAAENKPTTADIGTVFDLEEDEV